MKITLVGTGYVGLVSGTCFAKFGHQVHCLDKNPRIIESLKAGKATIYEQGLEELLAEAQSNMKFSLPSAEAFSSADAVFLCVGTPEKEDGSANLEYLFQAAKEASPHLKKGALVVTKSTVPVGTHQEVQEILKTHCPHQDFHIASNPEFLREGCAIKDFLEPDRVLVGVESKEAEALLREIYADLITKDYTFFVTDLTTAELTKYAANAYLATRLSFINEISDICGKYKGNIRELSYAMGLDNRIGTHYLNPGPGYGGSCFPKDTQALQKIAEKVEVETPILKSVISFNDNRKAQLSSQVRELFGDLKGKNISLLGLAFKAHTNDVRDSPALDLAAGLLKEGALISAYDPEATEDFKESLNSPYAQNIRYCNSIDEALKESEGAVIITEWPEFKSLKPSDFQEMQKTRVVDFRLLLKNEDFKESGVELYSLGSF